MAVETISLKDKQPNFGDLITLGEYRNPFWRKAVAALKFSYLTEIADSLAIIFAGVLAQANWDLNQAIIIPIPLHKTRERERGFNQSAVISEKISAICHIAWDDNLLIKNKKTKSQTTFSHQKRFANIASSFSLANTNLDKIKNKTVLLLDDVITTGATITEAANLISQAQPRLIHLLGVARGS
ncbi:MAG: hypothetical protein A2233_04140 [Candidatus Kerfeldbacteria bacterium RIFOXYA2_FULL_38_24]|uniref:Phosphoribosyltransferase domain-containing protein n=1 Tax=Candidatus Kerfeldbacteria bacterium RIFOXYB2_FULL_38_14 TaxID=1798547 RepID=A0A1G2BCJ1_9BACT|nr:MAG: hypothetical protein A2233_04140 [Candidatus Kerfeldbacteria bacterium RIFOXYA2_FULL_38_24]OGY86755.1 MAG: hypothetical protein A2319_00870 [Candidatus Kerfeldbacteria bacterium RIFOXYB2_FULL_38_14]OGY89007.1 MAG: hypothetical protein A2458_04940 [Candidatus Kerfeldbacteria bacterium RIFOXYC2_FULL_38_9]